MSGKRKLWLVAIGSIVVELAAWYGTRDPAQRRYLASVVKQIPHLPGRYAV